MNMATKTTLADLIKNNPTLMGMAFAVLLYGGELVDTAASAGAGHTGP